MREANAVLVVDIVGKKPPILGDVVMADRWQHKKVLEQGRIVARTMMQTTFYA